MGRKVALVVAGIHLIFFLLFVAFLHLTKQDSQSRLLWLIWVPLDFPISLIVVKGLQYIHGDGLLFSLLRFYLPYFVHGVIGAVWWYSLIRFVAFSFGRLGKINKGE